MKEFIDDLLTQASYIANRSFRNVITTVKQEDNNQVLTEADIAIGKYIVEKIAEKFPTDNIIDEEAGVIDRGSNRTWVIDPIDGTSNFAAGLPHFGIMIGLLESDQPLAGGIALPAYNLVYTAEKGRGAFCGQERISVSKEKMLRNALVAYGIDGHKEIPDITYAEGKILASIVLEIRNLRTSNSAYDLAMVAAGKYGAIMNQTSKIWDNVAPQIIIEEAGGIYAAFDGTPIDYSDCLLRVDQNFTVCAGAPALYEQLQAIIHKQ
ncbi:MAG: inositol monophosphatase [Candidatus Saccharimonadales bacterium]